MVSVVVRGRISGREGTGDLRLELAPEVTARELIGATVAAQLVREGVVWADCSRLYLTDGEIAAMAVEGAVRLGVVEGGTPPSVAGAAALAVEAFRRGVFAMFVGSRRVDELDEVVVLAEGDRVVLLRLTALVGG